MKLKLILPIFIILSQTCLFGQIINPDSVFEPKLCGKLYEMPTGYKGSQYYNAEWANADILLSNGEMAVNKLVKYNGFIDELIWKNTMNLMEVKLEKHFVDGFELKNYQGKTIHFKRLMVKLPLIADSSELFVEVLAEHSASCYVYRKIVIKGYDLKDIEGKTYISNDLIAQPQYILILPDKQVVIFKHISKHAVLKALPEKYRISAKSLLQKNHIPLRSEENLKTLSELIE
jgi:hypothetical protein